MAIHPINSILNWFRGTNSTLRGFSNWYQQNNSFIDTPLASQEWDKQISKKQVRKAIATSNEKTDLCQQVETRLAQDYADLLDIQLRSAFQKLEVTDIANPVGFSDISRGSINMQNYFQCYNIMDKFIEADILGHKKRATQLHAFERWVEVANILLTQCQNYEAFTLIMLRLATVETDLKNLIGLSDSSKTTYNTLGAYICPIGNFRELRKHIQENNDPRVLRPSFLLSRDVLFLNETLGESKNLTSADVKTTHESYENIKKKEEILAQFSSTKNTEIKKQPSHLLTTYTILEEQYKAQAELQQRNDSLAKETAKHTPLRRNSADAELPKRKTELVVEEKGHKRQRSKSLDSAHAPKLEITAPKEESKKHYNNKVGLTFWHKPSSIELNVPREFILMLGMSI
ncbi:RasGEF domain-containing protein [Legionella rowbothamii]|uniref:RasGEF domain-containing protein n=1 Tax=Legionella rowbothamii TaxID=96229 RepID=UPI001056C1A1|nr:RasGEF domain-containing protein [Legionella rowbothamii]